MNWIKSIGIYGMTTLFSDANTLCIITALNLKILWKIKEKKILYRGGVLWPFDEMGDGRCLPGSGIWIVLRANIWRSVTNPFSLFISATYTRDQNFDSEQTLSSKQKHFSVESSTLTCHDPYIYSKFEASVSFILWNSNEKWARTTENRYTFPTTTEDRNLNYHFFYLQPNNYTEHKQ